MVLFNIVLSTADVKFFKATQDALWIPAYQQSPYRQSEMLPYHLYMKPLMCTTLLCDHFSKIIFWQVVIAAYRQSDCRYAEKSRQFNSF